MSVNSLDALMSRHTRLTNQLAAAGSSGRKFNLRKELDAVENQMAKVEQMAIGNPQRPRLSLEFYSGQNQRSQRRERAFELLRQPAPQNPIPPQQEDEDDDSSYAGAIGVAVSLLALGFFAYRFWRNPSVAASSAKPAQTINSLITNAIQSAPAVLTAAIKTGALPTAPVAIAAVTTAPAVVAAAAATPVKTMWERATAKAADMVTDWSRNHRSQVEAEIKRTYVSIINCLSKSNGSLWKLVTDGTISHSAFYFILTKGYLTAWGFSSGKLGNVPEKYLGNK